MVAGTQVSAEAGIQFSFRTKANWVPTFVGMTTGGWGGMPR